MSKVRDESMSEVELLREELRREREESRKAIAELTEQVKTLQTNSKIAEVMERLVSNSDTEEQRLRRNHKIERQRNDLSDRIAQMYRDLASGEKHFLVGLTGEKMMTKVVGVSANQDDLHAIKKYNKFFGIQRLTDPDKQHEVTLLAGTDEEIEQAIQKWNRYSTIGPAPREPQPAAV